jgi:hypothetical protein
MLLVLEQPAQSPDHEQQDHDDLRPPAPKAHRKERAMGAEFADSMDAGKPAESLASRSGAEHPRTDAGHGIQDGEERHSAG